MPLTVWTWEEEEVVVVVGLRVTEADAAFLVPLPVVALPSSIDRLDGGKVGKGGGVPVTTVVSVDEVVSSRLVMVVSSSVDTRAAGGAGRIDDSGTTAKGDEGEADDDAANDLHTILLIIV